MVAVPTDTPVTMPVEPTVAMAVEPLVHVPPPVTSLRVVVAPAHNVPVPVMGEGAGFTVTALVTKAEQPAPFVTVYVMVAEPTATPVTTPEVLTVAMEVLPLVHVPPGVASNKEPVAPTHAVAVPVMAPTTGSAFTVTGAVLVHPVDSV